MKLPRAVVMNATSYAKFQHRYGGQYIARQNGKVLASGTTYPQLLRAIRQRGLNRRQLIVGYVPPEHAICIYVGHVSARQ